MTKMPTSSLGEACGGVTANPPRPMPPQAPPPSVTKHENPRVTFVPIPNSHQDLEDFFHKCTMSFDGVKEKESLRHLLKAWMRQSWRRDNEAKRSRQNRRAIRPRQRPSLPPEARGTPKGGGGGKYNRAEHSSLAVCGNQSNSLPQNGQFARGAEAAAARWEKRYNMQVSITEEALLAKRSAEISLRETKRVLHAVRAEAATVAREAASAKEEEAKALEVREGGRDENGSQDGLIQTLEAREMFTKIETDLRRRLQDTQDRLAEAEEEGMKLRQVLTECLASLGLVRGVPDEEFHMCLSALRDRAEEAGRGFLSVEGLHAAAEGARALDASRSLTRQVRLHFSAADPHG